MTLLAHEALLLGIPIDLPHLYHCGDPDFVLWLETVVEMIDTTVERRMIEQRNG